MITLLYVGVQLRQNTNAIRSATMQSVFETTNDVWKNNCQDVARTEQFVGITEKPQRTHAETLFFRSWATLTFRAQENIYYQTKLRTADPAFVNLEKRLRASMSLPYIRRAWDEGLVQEYLSDAYIEYVQETIQA